MSLLADRTAHVVVAIEEELDRLLPVAEGPLGRLGEAMRYAAMGGGKRFRPILVAAVADLGNAEPAAVTRVGAAIEMVHAYSLVHDDLPAMDDALLRRGKPTCHRVFGEAVAILAGDALLTHAFEALTAADWPCSAELRCSLAAALGRAAGATGMCGGQLLDLAAERGEVDVEAVLELERLKTGAMIAFACDAGALLAGLEAATRAEVAAYAADLGVAFQIRDDLLDAEGDALSTGKDSGIDAAADKATLIRLLGLDGARAELAALAQRASTRLDKLGAKATLLRELLSFVVNRSA